MFSSSRRLRMALAALGVALAGCGTNTTVVRTVVRTVSTPPAASVPTTTTTATDAGPATTTPSGGHALTACDPQISVRAGATTCAFAENVFYEYYTSNQAGPVEAYSPALGRMVHADCTAGATFVDCTAGEGGEVRFSLSAISNYSQSQADRYAATHRTRP
jgi:hypothetical protein